jgi:hypothetical protein
MRTTSASRRQPANTRRCTVPMREVVHGRSVSENLEFADYDSLEDSSADYALADYQRCAVQDNVGTVSERSRPARSDLSGCQNVCDLIPLHTSSRRSGGPDKYQAGHCPSARTPSPGRQPVVIAGADRQEAQPSTPTSFPTAQCSRSRLAQVPRPLRIAPRSFARDRLSQLRSRGDLVGPKALKFRESKPRQRPEVSGS